MGRRIDWSGSGREPFKSYVYFKPYSLLSFFIYLVQIINLEFFFCKNGKNLRKTSEERLKDSPKDIANSLIKIPSCFKQENSAINVFICGILPRNDLYSINRLLIKKKTNNILNYHAPQTITTLSIKMQSGFRWVAALNLIFSIRISCTWWKREILFSKCFYISVKKITMDPETTIS